MKRFSLRLSLATLSLLLSASCQLGTTGLEPVARAGDPLPADVHPESLSRMPLLTTEDLDEIGQEMAQLVRGENADNPEPGVEEVALYSPAVAEALYGLNEYLRTNSTLEPQYYQAAVLVTAREMDDAFSWASHEQAARGAGVPENVIEVIKNDLDVVDMTPQYANILRMGRQVFRQHRVTPDVWSRSVEYFGAQGAVEISAVMGNFAMRGLLLLSVDQQLAPGMDATLPARPGYVRE